MRIALSYLDVSPIAPLSVLVLGLHAEFSLVMSILGIFSPQFLNSVPPDLPALHLERILVQLIQKLASLRMYHTSIFLISFFYCLLSQKGNAEQESMSNTTFVKRNRILLERCIRLGNLSALKYKLLLERLPSPALGHTTEMGRLVFAVALTNFKVLLEARYYEQIMVDIIPSLSAWMRVISRAIEDQTKLHAIQVKRKDVDGHDNTSADLISLQNTLKQTHELIFSGIWQEAIKRESIDSNIDETLFPDRGISTKAPLFPPFSLVVPRTYESSPMNVAAPIGQIQADTTDRGIFDCATQTLTISFPSTNEAIVLCLRRLALEWLGITHFASRIGNSLTHHDARTVNDNIPAHSSMPNKHTNPLLLVIRYGEMALRKYHTSLQEKGRPYPTISKHSMRNMISEFDSNGNLDVDKDNPRQANSHEEDDHQVSPVHWQLMYYTYNQIFNVIKSSFGIPGLSSRFSRPEHLRSSYWCMDSDCIPLFSQFCKSFIVISSKLNLSGNITNLEHVVGALHRSALQLLDSDNQGDKPEIPPMEQGQSAFSIEEPSRRSIDSSMRFMSMHIESHLKSALSSVSEQEHLFDMSESYFLLTPKVVSHMTERAEIPIPYEFEPDDSSPLRAFDMADHSLSPRQLRPLVDAAYSFREPYPFLFQTVTRPSHEPISNVAQTTTESNTFLLRNPKQGYAQLSEAHKHCLSLLRGVAGSLQESKLPKLLLSYVTERLEKEATTQQDGETSLFPDPFSTCREAITSLQSALSTCISLLEFYASRPLCGLGWLGYPGASPFWSLCYNYAQFHSRLKGDREFHSLHEASRDLSHLHSGGKSPDSLRPRRRDSLQSRNTAESLRRSSLSGQLDTPSAPRKQRARFLEHDEMSLRPGASLGMQDDTFASPSHTESRFDVDHNLLGGPSSCFELDDRRTVNNTHRVPVPTYKDNELDRDTQLPSMPDIFVLFEQLGVLLSKLVPMEVLTIIESWTAKQSNSNTKDAVLPSSLRAYLHVAQDGLRLAIHSRLIRNCLAASGLTAPQNQTFTLFSISDLPKPIDILYAHCLLSSFQLRKSRSPDLSPLFLLFQTSTKSKFSSSARPEIVSVLQFTHKRTTHHIKKVISYLTTAFRLIVQYRPTTGIVALDECLSPLMRIARAILDCNPHTLPQSTNDFSYTELLQLLLDTVLNHVMNFGRLLCPKAKSGSLSLTLLTKSKEWKVLRVIPSDFATFSLFAHSDVLVSAFSSTVQFLSMSPKHLSPMDIAPGLPPLSCEPSGPSCAQSMEQQCPIYPFVALSNPISISDMLFIHSFFSVLVSPRVFSMLKDLLGLNKESNRPLGTNAESLFISCLPHHSALLTAFSHNEAKHKFHLLTLPFVEKFKSYCTFFVEYSFLGRLPADDIHRNMQNYSFDASRIGMRSALQEHFSLDCEPVKKPIASLTWTLLHMATHFTSLSSSDQACTTLNHNSPAIKKQPGLIAGVTLDKYYQIVGIMFLVALRVIMGSMAVHLSGVTAAHRHCIRELEESQGNMNKGLSVGGAIHLEGESSSTRSSMDPDRLATYYGAILSNFFHFTFQEVHALHPPVMKDPSSRNFGLVLLACGSETANAIAALQSVVGAPAAPTCRGRAKSSESQSDYETDDSASVVSTIFEDMEDVDGAQHVCTHCLRSNVLCNALELAHSTLVPQPDEYEAMDHFFSAALSDFVMTYLQRLSSSCNCGSTNLRSVRTLSLFRHLDSDQVATSLLTSMPAYSLVTMSQKLQKQVPAMYKHSIVLPLLKYPIGNAPEYAVVTLCRCVMSLLFPASTWHELVSASDKNSLPQLQDFSSNSPLQTSCANLLSQLIPWITSYSDTHAQTGFSLLEQIEQLQNMVRDNSFYRQELPDHIPSSSYFKNTLSVLAHLVFLCTLYKSTGHSAFALSPRLPIENSVAFIDTLSYHITACLRIWRRVLTSFSKRVSNSFSHSVRIASPFLSNGWVESVFYATTLSFASSLETKRGDLLRAAHLSRQATAVFQATGILPRQLGSDWRGTFHSAALNYVDDKQSAFTPYNPVISAPPIDLPPLVVSLLTDHAELISNITGSTHISLQLATVTEIFQLSKPMNAMELARISSSLRLLASKAEHLLLHGHKESSLWLGILEQMERYFLLLDSENFYMRIIAYLKKEIHGGTMQRDFVLKKHVVESILSIYSSILQLGRLVLQFREILPSLLLTRPQKESLQRGWLSTTGAIYLSSIRKRLLEGLDDMGLIPVLFQTVPGSPPIESKNIYRDGQENNILAYSISSMASRLHSEIIASHMFEAHRLSQSPCPSIVVHLMYTLHQFPYVIWTNPDELTRMLRIISIGLLSVPSILADAPQFASQLSGVDIYDKHCNDILVSLPKSVSALKDRILFKAFDSSTFSVFLGTVLSPTFIALLIRSSYSLHNQFTSLRSMRLKLITSPVGLSVQDKCTFKSAHQEMENAGVYDAKKFPRSKYDFSTLEQPDDKDRGGREQSAQFYATSWSHSLFPATFIQGRSSSNFSKVLSDINSSFAMLFPPTLTEDTDTDVPSLTPQTAPALLTSRDDLLFPVFHTFRTLVIVVPSTRSNLNDHSTPLKLRSVSVGNRYSELQQVLVDNLHMFSSKGPGSLLHCLLPPYSGLINVSAPSLSLFRDTLTGSLVSVLQPIQEAGATLPIIHASHAIGRIGNQYSSDTFPHLVQALLLLLEKITNETGISAAGMIEKMHLDAPLSPPKQSTPNASTLNVQSLSKEEVKDWWEKRRELESQMKDLIIALEDLVFPSSLRQNIPDLVHLLHPAVASYQARQQEASNRTLGSSAANFFQLPCSLELSLELHAIPWEAMACLNSTLTCYRSLRYSTLTTANFASGPLPSSVREIVLLRSLLLPPKTAFALPHFVSQSPGANLLFSSLQQLQGHYSSRQYLLESLCLGHMKGSALSSEKQSRINLVCVIDSAGDLVDTRKTLGRCIASVLAGRASLIHKGSDASTTRISPPPPELSLISLGRVPDIQKLLLSLGTVDAGYFYAGHGAGESFLPRFAVSSILSHGVPSLLFGCSSLQIKQPILPPNMLGWLTQDSHLTTEIPYPLMPRDGPVLHYLAESPIHVVGFLWDVTDKDSDRMVSAIFEHSTGIQMSYTSNSSAHSSRATLTDPSNSLLSNFDPFSSLFFMAPQVLPLAKTYCRLPILVGSAAATYGIPPSSSFLSRTKS